MRVSKIIFSLLVALPSMVHAQLEGVSYEWEQQRDRDGIEILTSSVDGSPYKAVRGVMTVRGSVASLFALVEDTEACPNWAAFCKESRVEQRISEFESYVYVYNDMPFPVSDRDVYTHVVWSRDPASKRISMTSTATDGGTKRTKAVRIENAVSQWHFTPESDGTTIVENFGHIDPNGPTPAWITNMLLVDSPFDSMQKMRELIEGGAYSDAVLGIDKF